MGLLASAAASILCINECLAAYEFIYGLFFPPSALFLHFATLVAMCCLRIGGRKMLA